MKTKVGERFCGLLTEKDDPTLLSSTFVHKRATTQPVEMERQQQPAATTQQQAATTQPRWDDRRL